MKLKWEIPKLVDLNSTANGVKEDCVVGSGALAACGGGSGANIVVDCFGGSTAVEDCGVGSSAKYRYG